MDYKEAREKYIHQWGVLGSSWGISKTMAQIHALLMISPEPLSTDSIMEELGISRGNVSMSIKSLMDYGIVYKDYKMGDRKDYFHSEKDVWTLATQVAKERRKRELDPVIKMLEQVSQLKASSDKKEQEFVKMTGQLKKFAVQSDTFLSGFVKAEQNWFFSKVFKLFTK